jgi:hypothetical protein
VLSIIGGSFFLSRVSLKYLTFSSFFTYLVTVWVLIPKSLDHLLLALERRTRNEKKNKRKGKI